MKLHSYPVIQHHGQGIIFTVVAKQKGAKMFPVDG
jgi:hypothetical protein